MSIPGTSSASMVSRPAYWLDCGFQLGFSLARRRQRRSGGHRPRSGDRPESSGRPTWSSAFRPHGGAVLFSAVTPLSEAVGGIRTALGLWHGFGFFPVRYLAYRAVALRFDSELAEKGERIATARFQRRRLFGQAPGPSGIASLSPSSCAPWSGPRGLAVAMELRPHATTAGVTFYRPPSADRILRGGKPMAPYP
jgi:hypothetical protein